MENCIILLSEALVLYANKNIQKQLSISQQKGLRLKCSFVFLSRELDFGLQIQLNNMEACYLKASTTTT